MSEQDELKDWLTSQGFRAYSNGLASTENQCKWYACKRFETKHRCELNDNKDGIQIVIYPFKFRIHDHQYRSAEIDLTGEAGGVWYKLQAYSISWEDLPDMLDVISDALVKAWEALPR